MYYPDKEIIFSRMHEPKNWSLNMVKDDSRTAICFEIFCDEGDELWQSADKELFDKVSNDLIRVGIATRAQISDYFIQRIGKAYPLFYLGSEKPLNIAIKSLSKLKNLFLVGRTGTHSYFDMDECLNDVKALVAKIIKIKDVNSIKMEK